VLTKGCLVRNREGCLEGSGFFLYDLRDLDPLGVKEKLGGLIKPLSANDDFLNGIFHPAPGKHGRNEWLDSLERLRKSESEKYEAKEWIHSCACIWAFPQSSEFEGNHDFGK